MARVCLIYPRDINLNFFPLGVGYVASYLEQKGHEVTLLDLSHRDLGILQHLKDREFDVAGISITTPQLDLASAVIRTLRETFPGTPIVAGGIHPSYFMGQFLEDHDVDYVVYGEGELTMHELCVSIESGKPDKANIRGLIYRSPEGIKTNPPREFIQELDQLPFPSRSLTNFETYLLPPGLIRGVWTNRSTNITTSRGCPGRCTYCGANFLWGKRYRRRSVDNVLAEIDFLVERYDIDGLFIMDDTFLMNAKWIREFCEKYKRRGYKLTLTCYGRIDTVTDEILRLAREAGFTQIEYGIESCSSRVLKKIKKPMDIQRIIDAVTLTKKHGMRVFGSFIFGFPDDEEQDLIETIETARSLNLDFATCYFATPYPGSELYEQALTEQRIVEQDMSKWYVRSNKIWKVNLSPDVLHKYRQKFLKQSRLSNFMFFLKKPEFLFRLLAFMVKNTGAFSKALRDSFAAKCFDDFGYYFYTHLSSDLKSRNVV